MAGKTKTISGPYQSYQIRVSVANLAELVSVQGAVDGAPTYVKDQFEPWYWFAQLPAGVTLSTDGSTGAIAGAHGGVYVGLSALLANTDTQVFTNFGTVSSGLIRAGMTRFVSMYVFWGGTPNPSYFQLFDKATPPVAGDMPKVAFRVQNGSSFIGSMPLNFGVEFPLGLGFAWSSTLPTFTDATVLTPPVVTTVFYK